MATSYFNGGVGGNELESHILDDGLEYRYSSLKLKRVLGAAPVISTLT